MLFLQAVHPGGSVGQVATISMTEQNDLPWFYTTKKTAIQLRPILTWKNNALAFDQQSSETTRILDRLKENHFVDGLPRAQLSIDISCLGTRFRTIQNRLLGLDWVRIGKGSSGRKRGTGSIFRLGIIWGIDTGLGSFVLFGIGFSVSFAQLTAGHPNDHSNHRPHHHQTNGVM
jgi:hypothetical protein